MNYDQLADVLAKLSPAMIAYLRDQGLAKVDAERKRKNAALVHPVTVEDWNIWEAQRRRKKQT